MTGSSLDHVSSDVSQTIMVLLKFLLLSKLSKHILSSCISVHILEQLKHLDTLSSSFWQHHTWEDKPIIEIKAS